MMADALLALRKSGMAPGQLWRGLRGSPFRVTVICVTRPSCEPMVGRLGPDGVTWLYPLAMFMGRAKQGNALVPRFVLCEE